MEEKYLFVVPQKAMIQEGGKFLILKRSPDAHTYPNHWDFPGGRLESGEDIKEGLERLYQEKADAFKGRSTNKEDILNRMKLIDDFLFSFVD